MAHSTMLILSVVIAAIMLAAAGTAWFMLRQIKFMD